MTPFDYIKSINDKKYIDDVTDYNPYLTNVAFSLAADTVMLANEMNRAHYLPPKMQYDFYYHTVRKAKRYNKWPKKIEEDPNLALVAEFYKYSMKKAREVLPLLSNEQLNYIKRKLDRGLDDRRN